MKKFIKSLMDFLWLPFMLPIIIAYLFAKEKSKIQKDLNAFSKVHYKQYPTNYLHSFYQEFIHYPEFRSVFYMRIGHWSRLFKFIVRPAILLSLCTPSHKFGSGIFIQHGNSTIVDAESIGENFGVNQNVTIGWRKDGFPTIGNNVRIGTGAVVLGKITIGDNVNIGAGAIVIKDVPSNCTVVSPSAYIIRRNGIPVHEELI